MSNGQGIRFYPNGTIYEGGWKVFFFFFITFKPRVE